MGKFTSNFSRSFQKTVLLKDVFEAINVNIVPKPSVIMMKIDIEHFECRAFLGSSEVLQQNQDVALLAVIMEWTFGGQNGTYSEQCPKEKVVSLTKLFLSKGYVPFQVTKGIRRIIHGGEWVKLNSSNFGLDWNTNVLWVSTRFVILAIDKIKIKRFSFNL